MEIDIRRMLDLGVIAASRPLVLGEGDGLDHAVRGVHVAESADISGLLTGGELILSSGLSLTSSTEGTTSFLQRLHKAGASCVVFSFLSDTTEVKRALMRAAATSRIPVILLDDRVRFIEITEAVREAIHPEARGRSDAEAIPSFLMSPAAIRMEVVQAFATVAEMLHAPLIFEDSLARVIMFHGLDSELLQQYAHTPRGGGATSSEDWFVTDKDWASFPVVCSPRQVGRLVFPAWLRATPALTAVIPQISAFLVSRVSGDMAMLDLFRQQTLTAVVTRVRASRFMTDDAALRMQLLGLDLCTNVTPVAVHITTKTDGPDAAIQFTLDGVLTALQEALVAEHCPAVAVPLDGAGAGLLLQRAAPTDDATDLTQLHEVITLALRRVEVTEDWTMGVGPATTSLGSTATKGLDDALRVARSASTLLRPRRPFYRASDLGFRCLLHHLLEHEDTQIFVRDQLAPLLDEGEHLDFLEAYLRTNGSVADLSRSIHLSRPSVYARIHRITRALGRDLTDADTRTSLQLAIALHRHQTRTRPGGH